MSADALLWVIVGAQASAFIVCLPMNVRIRRIANARRAEVKSMANGITGQIWYGLAAGAVVTSAWVWLFFVTGKWQFLFIGAVPFVGQRITAAGARL